MDLLSCDVKKYQMSFSVCMGENSLVQSFIVDWMDIAVCARFLVNS